MHYHNLKHLKKKTKMTDNIVSKHGCLFRCLYPQNMGVRVYQTCCHGATLITLQWKDANKSKF